MSLSGDVPSYTRAIVPAPQPDGNLQFRPQQQTNSQLNLVVTQELPQTGGSIAVISALNQLKRTGAPETWSSTPVSVQLTQPILRPRVQAWNREEEELRAEVAERNYAEAIEDAGASAVGAFFDLYAARITLQNATDNVARNDTLYQLAVARRDQASVGAVEVLQSELALLRARQTRDQAQISHDRAEAALRLLLNLPDDAPVDIVDSLGTPTVVVDTALAVAQARQNRAAFVTLELQDTQAHRAETQARLNNGVGANLTASYGYNAIAPQFGDVYGDLLERQTFRLNVTMPILQWGAGDAEVEAARAQRAGVAVSRRLTEGQVAMDVEFAARQLAQAQQGLAIAEQADSVARQRFELALLHYRNGTLQLENLFNAQNEMNNAVQQRVDSMRQIWTQYYLLRRATMFDFEAGRPIRHGAVPMG
jgi:outer membrane protein TolC